MRRMMTGRPRLRSFLAIAVSVAAVAPVWAKNVDIKPPAIPSVLPVGRQVGDVRYPCGEKASNQCSLEEFMRNARVCALVVVKSGKIRLQRFNQDQSLCGDDDKGRPNGWGKHYGIASVTKSITSTLLGQAIATRYRANSRAEFEAVLGRPVEDFVPQFGEARRKSAYVGVPLGNVLGMRSGVRWSEYGWHGFLSDSMRFSRDVRNNWKFGVVEFAMKFQLRSLSGYRRPFNYSALDAAVAAAVTEKMIHGKLTDFLQSGIWSAIGAEKRASWGIDKTGLGIGPCCFRAAVGDLARFGMLVLNKGRDPKGRELIPRAWFEVATQHGPKGVDAIPPGNGSYNRRCPLEYRYFWWLFPGRNDFTAVGRGGKFIHIYPSSDTVIVQISDWGRNGNYLECESFKAHDAIVNAMK